MSFKFGAFSGHASTGAQSSSSAGGGGGLYAGIALAGPNGSKKVTGEQQSASTTEISNPDASSNSKKTAHVQDDQAKAKNDSKKEDDKSKATASSWSSSLRFAPVIRKQPAKPVSKPFAVPFSSSVSVATKSISAAAAFAPEDDTETTAIIPTGRPMHIPGRAKAALTAPAPAAQPLKAPSVFARKGGFLAAHAPERIPGGAQPASVAASTTQPLPEKVDSSIPGFQHSLPAILAQTTTLKGLLPTVPRPSAKVMKKKLDQPPPLTLPDDELGTGGGGDVNGFAQSEAGRQLALRAARNSKKSKKKGKAREVDPAILFMEDYDPARPNDYHEWMNFVKRRRDMRREALRLERERQRRQEREEMSGSSYYSSDDDGSASDDAKPARANFFAPPPDYNVPSTKGGVDQSASSMVPAPPMARAETGDEAYARRVALSQGVPYRPPQPATAAQETNQVTIGPSAPPEAPAGSAPMVSIADAQARAKAIAERLQKLRYANNEPAAPPSASETTSSHPAPQQPVQSVATTTMLEAQAKAKLIAAKLAALNGANAASSTSSGPGSATVSQQPSNNPPRSSANESANKAPGQPDFARRLMDKYGWKEGQGLGPTESGRTSILTVAPSASNPTGNKKRKDNPGEGGVAGPVGPNKVGAMGKGRGMVVDETRTQREMEEKARFGEPTRVVYLTNVVAVHEVDDELAMEIAEEARKHGIVERCFVRVVKRPVEHPSEAVRVFLLYSGLVGAWKAVKTFDGRFFGGRNIRARFFSENSFTLGDWDV